jgi:diguanylate cyclase (GGDEF)-like protein
MLPGLLARRRALVAAVFSLYLGLVFVGLEKVEVPGLGIGHFLYIPVVLLALSYGPRWGAGLGATSAALYVIASALNTHFEPDEQALSISSGIRFCTFVLIGWLVGAAAGRNRELMARLKEHAERDFLTDLLNTRAFESALTERLDTGEPFSLVLADVDDLKLINDSEGHAAGDDHLRRLAAVLREETAPEDTVARIGGDEFAILAAGSGEALADRLRAAASGRGLGVSLGWASHPDDGTDRLTLFRTADKRLYHGKLGSSRRLRSVG